MHTIFMLPKGDAYSGRFVHPSYCPSFSLSVPNRFHGNSQKLLNGFLWNIRGTFSIRRRCSYSGALLTRTLLIRKPPLTGLIRWSRFFPIFIYYKNTCQIWNLFTPNSGWFFKNFLSIYYKIHLQDPNSSDPKFSWPHAKVYTLTCLSKGVNKYQSRVMGHDYPYRNEKVAAL